MKPLRLTTNSLEYVCQELRKLDLNGKAYEVKLSDYSKRRTLSANAQQHVFYTEISDGLGDVSPLEVKNMCKDLFGIPILLKSERNSDRVSFMLDKLDYYKYSYENRLKIIQGLSVTSEFNAAESKEYMDQMIRYWNDQDICINYKK